MQPGARERGILPAARHHGGIMNARYVLGLDQARNWLAASGWRSKLPRGRSEYDSSRTSTLILGLMHHVGPSTQRVDTPEAISLSPIQDMALQHACFTSPVSPTAPPCSESEKRIYSYRLLIAAPWSQRNADHAHALASAVGRHFDGVRARTVPNNLIRRTASAMCSWGAGGTGGYPE